MKIKYVGGAVGKLECIVQLERLGNLEKVRKVHSTVLSH